MTSNILNWRAARQFLNVRGELFVHQWLTIINLMRSIIKPTVVYDWNAGPYTPGNLIGYYLRNVFGIEGVLASHPLPKDEVMTPDDEAWIRSVADEAQYPVLLKYLHGHTLLETPEAYMELLLSQSVARAQFTHNVRPKVLPGSRPHTVLSLLANVDLYYSPSECLRAINQAIRVTECEFLMFSVTPVEDNQDVATQSKYLVTSREVLNDGSYRRVMPSVPMRPYMEWVAEDELGRHAYSTIPYFEEEILWLINAICNQHGYGRVVDLPVYTFKHERVILLQRKPRG